MSQNDPPKGLFPDEPETVRPRKQKPTGQGPPNLGQPIAVDVPDFGDPRRPKTCLEVDFPIVPINALSILEGNAGKPIYQMSKWWARRRGCVFRAILLAAAMKAPVRRNPDGSVQLDDKGVAVPDDDEAAKAVWDVYYANHEQAGSFRHLKVLDCFMGGGTTLVEGSRLGFQVAGVDLNPVAWFIVKNELARTDPEEVKKLFKSVEDEVKPQVQPFYVTECPRGHQGVWTDVRTAEAATVDPAILPAQERKHYRYAGPEVIYTFWAKHGPCIRGIDCSYHRTPVFRSPVIAEKKLGVKYIALTCKSCKAAFHAELGSARMAPAAARVVLDTEQPFTELSQPFAHLLGEYDNGKMEERLARVEQLAGMVDREPGLKCPRCGVFAGEWVKDVVAAHLAPGRKLSTVKKKDLKILPERNSTKPVYCYLLVHPDWLKGSPGRVDGQELGGQADATPEANAKWYAERLKGLTLIEVRGRIKLAEDTSAPVVSQTTLGEDEAVDEERTETVQEQEVESGEAGEAEPEGEAASKDRKKYGLPRYITLGDGRKVDTRTTTIPSKSRFSCGNCGTPQDLRESVKETGHTALGATYAIQGYCPECDGEGFPYGGRFFTVPNGGDIASLTAAEREWTSVRETALRDYWPQDEIPFTFMTHQNNGGIPNWGYTHFYKMFNSRQLLVLSKVLASILSMDCRAALRDQALGAFQQYLRNQNMFCIYDVDYDKLVPFFSNPNYAPKALVLENSVFGKLGRGNWNSCVKKVIAGLEWAKSPWELVSSELPGKAGVKVFPEDPIVPTTDFSCSSASALPAGWLESFDIVITDPPFSGNVYYGDLANFFHAWLRPILTRNYPEVFGTLFSPRAQECVADRSRHPGMAGKEAEGCEPPADEFYEDCLTQCWAEAWRVSKLGGLLAFTFHHSKDSPWETVLRSLFNAGWILESTFPIVGDETKGGGSKPGTFGSQKIEYDIIHVCRKRFGEAPEMSWAKMRQWVKAELHRLRGLLESYKARELSEADIRVILRGKALEFYSRHYGKIYTSEDELLSIREALLGINQLLDEETGDSSERPRSIIQPIAYQFLRLFGTRSTLPRDDVGKSLRGTRITPQTFDQRGWTREENKLVCRVPIRERFEHFKNRSRHELRSEIDQAHFLIGAAVPGSGIRIEEELERDETLVRRSVEAVLQWYARTAPEQAVREAAERALGFVRRSIERLLARKDPGQQRSLFYDLKDDTE